jgi:hypothetical protein
MKQMDFGPAADFISFGQVGGDQVRELASLE